MKPKTRVSGTIPNRKLPPRNKTVCPSCHTTGKYKTDKRGETYCTQCGLIIDSKYPYTAGNRYWLLCDFKYENI